MSDTSDVEGWTAPGSRRASKTSSSAAGNTMNSTFHRCGRVRAGALMLLQAMIRGDPAALQPHWPSILPSHDPVGARHGSSHLLTVIMSDPGPKVSMSPVARMGLATKAGPATNRMITASSGCSIQRT
jgi:hypothetical protein